jgi:hypothetical protein
LFKEEWNGMLSINSIYKEPYGIQEFVEFDVESFN